MDRDLCPVRHNAQAGPPDEVLARGTAQRSGGAMRTRACGLEERPRGGEVREGGHAGLAEWLVRGAWLLEGEQVVVHQQV